LFLWPKQPLKALWVGYQNWQNKLKTVPLNQLLVRQPLH
jgi:hypothetical protein